MTSGIWWQNCMSTQLMPIWSVSLCVQWARFYFQSHVTKTAVTAKKHFFTFYCVWKPYNLKCMCLYFIIKLIYKNVLYLQHILMLLYLFIFINLQINNCHKSIAILNSRAKHRNKKHPIMKLFFRFYWGTNSFLKHIYIYTKSDFTYLISKQINACL